MIPLNNESQLRMVRYTAEFKAVWDHFVSNSRNGTFLLMRDYMDYHSDRFQDYSLMFYKGDRLVALLPGNIADNKYVSHGGLTYGGFILSYQATAIIVLEAISILQLYLQAIAVTHVIFRTIPYIYHRYPADEDLYALFRCGARLTERKISSVVIPGRNDCSFSTLRKRKLKLAQKSGLHVCQDNEFAAFWDVLNMNLAEKHQKQPVHSLNEMERLQQLFPEEIKLYRVLDGEKTVGGCVMYGCEKVAHVQYIGSTEQGREMGALELLFDHLIRSVYAGKDYFDFGISVEDGGRYLNEGLIFQKEGFGGRAVMYDTYEFSLNEDR